ncbi:MAG: hypothetical protein AMXMBFR84_26090 [Candidatus Hydrogenedentota bacterium]
MKAEVESVQTLPNSNVIRPVPVNEVDMMKGIPNHLKERLRNARALQNQAAQTVTDETPAAQPVETAAFVAAPQPVVQENQESLSTPPQPVPGPSPSAQVEAQPDFAKLTQDLRSLTGRFRVMEKRIAAKDAQISQLKAQLEAAPASSPPAKQLADPAPVGLEHFGVTDEELDMFGGEEALRVVQKVAEASAKAALSSTTPAVQQPAVVPAPVVSEGDFYSKLDAAVSNWYELDADPGFNAWLDSTGMRNTLAIAEKANNAEVAASIFRAYTPTPTPAPAVPPATPAQAIMPPQGGGAGATSSIPAKPVYTVAQAQKMLMSASRMRAGDVNAQGLTRDEVRALVINAQSEGRIQG